MLKNTEVTYKLSVRIISHRGNLNGPNSRENEPKYILEALSKGFEVEIDLWAIEDKLFLGDDFPEHEVNLDFLRQRDLWVHCKNLAALQLLSQYRRINCFSHKEDDFVLSSHGFIMLPPSMGYVKNCITMMPELNKEAKIIEDCGGVITDFPLLYQ